MNHAKYISILLTIAALSACDSGGGSDVDATPLIADAGTELSIEEGASVVLSGKVTGAAGAMSVSWAQVSGPMVTFSDANVLTPQVVVPRVRNSADAILRLTVTDGVATSTDDVVLTIANVSNGPGGPSPQGIQDDGIDDRRNRGPRGRRMVDSREIRTYDGSNNNLDNPEWGRAFAHLQRLGFADYGDGISTMSGATRASARAISNVVINQNEGVSVPNGFGRSDMVWQWGQFIDHDLDLTDGVPGEMAHIEVPRGDPQFDPAGTGNQIIPFNRAIFDPNTGTSVTNPREQENEITSWIDGSMIYGSDEERALALRVGPDSPFLATSAGNLLPFNVDNLPNANGVVPDPAALFLAGDFRANEQVGLATMHTLWVREHNRIARNLRNSNFSADAEVIFQQARRLVIAKIQKITYEEFLPALHGADPLPAYTGYDSSINPTIYNEFSVAAYRFGHSAVNQRLLQFDAGSVEIAAGHLSLREAFFTAPLVLTEESSIDPILRGLASQAHQAVDTMVIQDIRNFLFGFPGDGGLDLVALNIQRGRDHGVPSYNDMRVALGLTRYTAFEQITSDADVQVALASVYDNNIDQIDLWVGGLAEDAVGDSQFGELFDAIILRQFQELRDGDRFWYERHLTDDELASIEDVTLAKVIRDNTGITTELQDDVFSVQ